MLSRDFRAVGDAGPDILRRDVRIGVKYLGFCLAARKVVEDSDTQMRVPRMQGFPKHTFGSITMRSRGEGME